MRAMNGATDLADPSDLEILQGRLQEATALVRKLLEGGTSAQS